MKASFPLLAVFALTAMAGLSAALGQEVTPQNQTHSLPSSFVKEVLPFLTRHCYACHGNGKKRGEVSLDPYKDELSLQKDRKVWANVEEAPGFIESLP